MFMEVLKNLFERHFHSPVERVQPLQGQLGGSGRKVLRLANERSRAIGILYDVREENVAFLEFSRHFRRHGLPVPEIYAEDLAQGAYLEEDLGRLTKFLLSADHNYFLYRDFQSRNVMLRGGHPFFLDYQGGRKGALQYDIASLLYDAKADLPPELRQQLLDHYLDSVARL